MVLERLDAELGETDDEGGCSTYGKVAIVAVVGNEDGAPSRRRRVLQALNDTGFSVAANGSDLLGRRGHAGHRLQGPRGDA